MFVKHSRCLTEERNRRDLIELNLLDWLSYSFAILLVRHRMFQYSWLRYTKWLRRVKLIVLIKLTLFVAFVVVFV